MTVATTAAYTGPYYPNGVTTDYPFGFKVNSIDEVMLVYIEDDGTETPVPDANYTVVLSSNDNEPGGMVTTQVALPDSAGKPLYVALDATFTQGTKFEDEGAFNQSILNPALDAGALRSIWLRSRLLRALLVPFGEGGIVFPRAAARANKYLAFGADGGIILSAGSGADAGLRADLASQIGGTLVTYWRNVTGFVSRTITAKLFGYVDVEDFGAVGNGVTEDTLAWTRAITFVKTRGLKVRAMSSSYLVSTLTFDGSGYEVATTAGNLFKQKAGLTGDGNVHPIWAITGSNIKFGDASFEGNIATDIDEYSHAVGIFSAKNIETGVLNGKNIRGDVVYVYGRISSEAEMSRGIRIAGVTGDNVLRCILAVSGGEGWTGFVRRIGSMRVGYKDVDWEPNLVVGTANDYQQISWTMDYIYGAQVQCVSADPDVQNYSIAVGKMDLDGSRILNSVPAYGAHPGVNDFAISVQDCLSFDAGDVIIAKYQYSPIKLGDKLGQFKYKSLKFSECAISDNTYKSIILHLGTDAPAVVVGGLTQGTLYTNNKFIFRSDSQRLNLDVGQIKVTNGMFGSRVTGRVAGMTLDCGGAAGEIVFNDCDNMIFGKTTITNAAAAYGFVGSNNITFFDCTATFGTLDYGGSTNIVGVNSAINSALVPGINLILGGVFSIAGKTVAGPEGGAIADHGLAAGANPTKAEYDGLVTKFNTLLAQRRAGTTRQV